MRLHQVWTAATKVKAENREDLAATPLFVARVLRLLRNDAMLWIEPRSISAYVEEAITWFNDEVAPDRPFSFQQQPTSPRGSHPKLARDSCYRKATGVILGKVMAGAVAKDPAAWRLMTEVRNSADAYLADWALAQLRPIAEWGSEQEVQDFFKEVRRTTSFRSLLGTQDFVSWIDGGVLTIKEHEVRLKQAGLISRGLCS